MIDRNETINGDVEDTNRHFYMRIHPHAESNGKPIGAMLIFVDKPLLLQTQKELETMGLISQLCLAAEELEFIYKELPNIISKQFGFSYVVLDLIEDGEAVIVGTSGLDFDERIPNRAPLGNSISGDVVKTHKSLIQTNKDRLVAVSHPLLENREVKTCCCIPLRLKEKVVGVLILADPEYRDEIDELEETLLVIGHHLALEIERKRMSTTLSQQKETLQSIMDHIPIMLAFYDAAGRFQFVNREFEHLLGWSLEELNNHEDPMAEFYPDPEYRRKAWTYMMEASPGRRDFRVQTRKGGTLESAWANVKLSDGSQIGIGIDIRERKKLEERAKISEERLRLIADR